MPKPPPRPDQLKFDSLKVITFPFFLGESIFYILTYLTHKLLSVAVYVVYGLNGHFSLIGQVSLAIITMDLFSSGIRNFQKPISVICGPLYSKRDFFAYRVQRNKLLMLNSLCYLGFACIAFCLEPLYRLMRVEPASLANIVVLSKVYIGFYGPCMFLAKFLKGGSRAVTSRTDGGQAVPLVVFRFECGVLRIRSRDRLGSGGQARPDPLRVSGQLLCEVHHRGLDFHGGARPEW